MATMCASLLGFRCEGGGGCERYREPSRKTGVFLRGLAEGFAIDLEGRIVLWCFDESGKGGGMNGNGTNGARQSRAAQGGRCRVRMGGTGGHFTVRARLRSFAFAWAGVLTLLKTQHNMWVHFGAAVAAVGCGAWVGLSPVEWCVVALTVMAVWTAEACNTAIEFLADRVSMDHHPLIGKAKDVAAGAVLIAAAGAVVVGVILFLPHVQGR